MDRHSLPVALFAMTGSVILWMAALQGLAEQPVTHTGTQPHHRITTTDQ